MQKIAILLLIICFAACNDKTKIPDEFDYGKIEHGVYSNKFFNFEIQLPAGWTVQSKQMVDELQDRGTDAIAAKNKKLASQLKASEVNVANLLMVSKNPYADHPTEFNYSFAISAENLAAHPQLKTAEKYLDQAKNLMQQSGAYHSFSEYSKEMIGNREFTRMENIVNARGVDVRLSYYVLVEKGFSLLMMITYDTEENKGKLKEAINRIKFM